MKISLVGLGATALLQLAVVAVSGSVALLADTIHNTSDALTAVPLWIAFVVGRRGLLITAAILLVLRAAAREVFRRLMDGVEPDLVDAAEAAFLRVFGALDVSDLRLRWVGHEVRAEAAVGVAHGHSLAGADAIALQAERSLVDALPPPHPGRRAAYTPAFEVFLRCAFVRSSSALGPDQGAAAVVRAVDVGAAVGVGVFDAGKLPRWMAWRSMREIHPRLDYAANGLV